MNVQSLLLLSAALCTGFLTACSVEQPPPRISPPMSLVGTFSSTGNVINLDFFYNIHGAPPDTGLTVYYSPNPMSLVDPACLTATDDEKAALFATAANEIATAHDEHIANREQPAESDRRIVRSAEIHMIKDPLNGQERAPTIAQSNLTQLTHPDSTSESVPTGNKSVYARYTVLPDYVDGQRLTGALSIFTSGCYYFAITAYDRVVRVESDLSNIIVVEVP